MLFVHTMVFTHPLQQAFNVIFNQEFIINRKKNVQDPSNYRGKHLTFAISKCVERLIGNSLIEYLIQLGFGPQQFAFRKAKLCKRRHHHHVGTVGAGEHARLQSRTLLEQYFQRFR